MSVETLSRLLIDVGKVLPNVGGVIPGQMGPGCIRKVAKHDPASKLVNSIPLWAPSQFLPLGSCLEFVWWLLLMTDYSL